MNDFVSIRWTPKYMSARWTPENVVRRDTHSGTFEEINPRMYTQTEMHVQRALLKKPETATPVAIYFAVVAAIGVVAIVWHVVARAVA